jgi:hypothetical protein
MRTTGHGHHQSVGLQATPWQDGRVKSACFSWAYQQHNTFASSINSDLWICFVATCNHIATWIAPRPGGCCKTTGESSGAPDFLPLMTQIRAKSGRVAKPSRATAICGIRRRVRQRLPIARDQVWAARQVLGPNPSEGLCHEGRLMTRIVSAVWDRAEGLESP